MKMKILGAFQTTRFIKSAAVGVVFVFLANSIYYGFITFLFLSFSFVFNDWTDSEKDALGHPNRAIPSGKITRKDAGVIAAFLVALRLLLTYLFQREYLEGFLLAYTLSITYSFWLKPNIPIIATPVWSSAVSIVFLLPFTQSIYAYMSLAGIVFGYELLLDYRDRDTDKKFMKTPTSANVLGKFTFVLAGGLILSGVIGLVTLLWIV